MVEHKNTNKAFANMLTEWVHLLYLGKKEKI